MKLLSTVHQKFITLFYNLFMSSKEIDKAKLFYDAWRKEKTFSPALGKDILITRRGWNHIIGGDREFKDKIRRVKVLNLAKDLILKSTTIQDVRKSYGKTFIAFEHVFDIKRNYKVRVVLESNDGITYKFLSVMDKKI
jgi:hypothetical protein